MQGQRCIQMNTNKPNISGPGPKGDDRKEFWTTQVQFWQWVRDGVVIKTGEQPLTGLFKREHEELLVLLSNTVLNLAHPNHMREALLSRRTGISGK